VYSGVTDLRRPYQGRARAAFTINKTPQEVYDFVRNPQNWGRELREPKFEHDGKGCVTLRFGAENGPEFKSHVELTDEKPGEFIAWASEEQMLEHRGVLRFKKAPGDRGLRQIKQLMETGEIPTTEGQPVGARGFSGATKRVLYHERPAVEAQPVERLAGD
jgi:uncharacterized membrane protein